MLKGEVNFVANEMQNKEEMKEDHKGREGREGRDLEQEKRDYQQEKRDLEQQRKYEKIIDLLNGFLGKLNKL